LGAAAAIAGAAFIPGLGLPSAVIAFVGIFGAFVTDRIKGSLEEQRFKSAEELATQANESAAAAKVEADEARRALAEESATRQQIELQMAPRRLSDEAFQDVASVMRRLAGQTVKLLFYPVSGNGDVPGLADQLRRTMLLAGVGVSVNEAMGSAPPDHHGIYIGRAIDSSTELDQVTRLLVFVLAGAGLAAYIIPPYKPNEIGATSLSHLEGTTSVAPPTFAVIVYRKPTPAELADYIARVIRESRGAG
jgi:hypothetical protein